MVMNSGIHGLAFTLAMGLALGLAGAATAQPPEQPAPAQAAEANAKAASVEESDLQAVMALQKTLSRAIARAERSVVAIARQRNPGTGETLAIRGREMSLTFRNLGREEQIDFDLSSDYGSGVVIGESGQILTCYHVVEGAMRIRVRAFDGSGFDAEILAADPRSDLAVIAPVQLPSNRASVPELPPLELGRAEEMTKGSFVLALGNSFNAAKDGSASATWGIVSNTQVRFAHPRDVNTMQLRFLPTLWQLDAKLNLGLSGGPVIDLQGRLVALSTAAAHPVGFDAQAGYAIPMDGLGRRAARTLRAGREVEYGFLGIGLPQDGSPTVDRVVEGTPASLGGLVIEDRVLEIGGVPVETADELIVAINAQEIGEPVPMRVLRDDRVIERSVLLSKLQVDGRDGIVIATTQPEPWRGLRVDYSSTIAERNIIDREVVLRTMSQGLVGIAEVASGSPAEAVGLRRGMVIVAIDGQPVASPSQFRRRVAALDGPVTLDIVDLGQIAIGRREVVVPPSVLDGPDEDDESES